jgi:hypothetical protein
LIEAATQVLMFCWSVVNTFVACSDPFKNAPSAITLPDYYDLVDKKDVITWTQLRTRHFTSQGHFLSSIAQLQQNARVYNLGCTVPNKAYIPGGAEPEYVRKGPGKLACPAVGHLVDVFVQRVSEYLGDPEVAKEVRVVS